MTKIHNPLQIYAVFVLTVLLLGQAFEAEAKKDKDTATSEAKPAATTVAKPAATAAAQPAATAASQPAATAAAPAADTGADAKSAKSDKSKDSQTADKADKGNEVAGIVLAEVGAWSITKDKETHTIAEGDSIPDGWSLKQGISTGTITVLLNNGEIMKCPDINGACFSAIHNAKPTGWYANLVRTAMRLVSVQPERFQPAISRDFNSLILSDGVLQKDGNKIDLSPIVKSLADGKYSVALTKQNSDRGNSGGSLISTFEVKANKANKISLPGLQSDVYRLLISSQDKSRSGSAYIYAADRSQYPMAQEKFSRFVSALIGTQHNLSRSEHSIVRAFIFAFADKKSSSATD